MCRSYLLISKKRYAGMYWTNPVKWDKMDTTGIETQRRDNCGMVETTTEELTSSVREVEQIPCSASRARRPSHCRVLGHLHLPRARRLIEWLDRCFGLLKPLAVHYLRSDKWRRPTDDLQLVQTLTFDNVDDATMDGSYLGQEGCTYAFDDEIAAEVEELHAIESNWTH